MACSAHHHRVVAHARHVGAAGGGVAEHQRDGRAAAGPTGPGQVAEHLAAGDEDLLLGRQVRAAGLDQRDRRQAVLLGDLGRPEALLHRPRVARAALDRRVVGGDQALDALDHADAGDQRGADGEVRAPARQRRQLQERRPGVDEQLDPLARQELPARVVAVDVLLPAAADGLGVLGVEVGELLQHRLAVGHAHASTTAFIRSSVVRMPRRVGAPAQRPEHRPVDPHRQRRLEPEVLRHLRAARRRARAGSPSG